MKLWNTLRLIALSTCANISFAQDSLNISTIYRWSDTTLVGSAAYNNTYNEIWGVAQEGKEYAIMGTTDGHHIFDITNTGSEREVVYVAGRIQGTSIIHRDYHDYKGYLYAVSDEGASSLQIMDISHLPDSAPVVYDSQTLLQRAHNIFIDSANGMLYTCGGSGNHLSVYSLANPELPVLVNDCRDSVSWWSTTVGYVHDVYVENGIAFCNAETRGMFVVDFKNPKNPVLLGDITNYPEQGYNHSGWYNSNTQIYVMADETHSTSLKVIDASDYSNLNIKSLINNDVDTVDGILHNPLICGDYVFIGYYYDGLYIYDISDPAAPVLKGFYDTSLEPHRKSYHGAWGTYPFLPSGKILVSDMQEGLFVFDVTATGFDPAKSVEENSQNSTSFAVFPNPASQEVTFLSPSGNTELIYVYNQLGMRVKEFTFAAPYSKIDVSDLSGGIYLWESESSSGRIVIE